MIHENGESEKKLSEDKMQHQNEECDYGIGKYVPICSNLNTICDSE
jgi:hypothetical protein